MKNSKEKNILSELYASASSVIRSDRFKWAAGKIPLAICLIFATLSLAQIIYYTTGPAQGYFHADCTDSIYWAEAAVDGGAVFNPDFYYAALLPFSAQIWLVPLIRIFGVTMTAHVIGMVIFSVLFFASMIFLCRSMQWGWEMSLFTPSVVMLMLSSSDKMREIMWGHVIYYSLILVLLFVGIGLAARLLRKRTTALCILTALWAVLSATDGVQIVAMVLLPVAGAIIAERFFDGEKRLTDKCNFYPFCISAGIILAGSVGLLLLSLLKGDISADYADAHMGLTSVNNWADNLLKLPKAWFGLLGFDEMNKDIGKIPALLSALVGIVIAVLPICLALNYKKIEKTETKLLLWAHLALSAVTLGGWVCGVLSGADWRLVSMMGTSIVTSVAAVRHFLSVKADGEGSVVAKRLSVVLAVCLLAGSVISGAVMLKMPADYGRDNLDHRLAAKLKAEGLEYGYSTFWRSQTITLISDSEVRVREILADEFDGVSTDYYQSSRAWYEDQEGIDKYFVLLNDYEAGEASRNRAWESYVEENAVEIIDFENYVIYVFDENIDFEYLAKMQAVG